MLRGHAVGLRSQTTPEGIVCLDWLTGIETLQEKGFQFLLRSLKTVRGGAFHSGEGGVERFFGGRIGSGVDHRLDSLFLFGSELNGHDGFPFALAIVDLPSSY